MTRYRFMSLLPGTSCRCGPFTWYSYLHQVSVPVILDDFKHQRIKLPMFYSTMLCGKRGIRRY